MKNRRDITTKQKQFSGVSVDARPLIISLSWAQRTNIRSRWKRKNSREFFSSHMRERIRTGLVSRVIRFFTYIAYHYLGKKLNSRLFIRNTKRGVHVCVPLSFVEHFFFFRRIFVFISFHYSRCFITLCNLRRDRRKRARYRRPKLRAIIRALCKKY